MGKINFTKARLLTSEFQKKFAPFIMRQQAGRIAGEGQAYLCISFGLPVVRGLVIEVDLKPIADDRIPTAGCLDLPEAEFIGPYGTIPIRYIIQ